MKNIITREDSNSMRGLAIVFIVLHNLIHCIHIPENEFTFYLEFSNKFIANLFDGDWSIFMDILSFLGWYGVPVFLFLSGYGLVKKYEEQKSDVSISFFQFMKYQIGKLFKLIILPYLVYILLYNVIQKGTISFDNIIYQLTFISNLWPDDIRPGVYWFFGLMVQLYTCYYLFIYKRSNKSLIAINIVSFLALVLCIGLNGQLPGMFYIRHQCIGWILPFTLGVLYARYPISIFFNATWKNILVFVLCSALLVLFNLNAYLWLLSPVVAIILALYICDFAKRVKILNNVFVYLGTISAFLFAVHPILRDNYGSFAVANVNVSILIYFSISLLSAIIYKWLHDSLFIHDNKSLKEDVFIGSIIKVSKYIGNKYITVTKKIKKETKIDFLKSIAFCVLFALVLYVKCKLFLNLIDANFYHQFFYDRCISISLFIAAFALIIKNRIWAVVFCFIMDIWLISNMMYYNSCGFFIDIHAIMISYNLSGFEESAFALWQNKFLWMFAPTIVVASLMYFFKQKRRYFITWIVIVIFCYVCSCLGQDERRRFWLDTEDIPSYVYNPLHRGIFNSFTTLIQCNSPLHIIFYDIYDFINIKVAEKPEFTDIELQEIDNKLFNISAKEDSIGKLMIILVESLENWGVSSYSMPNLWKLMQETPHLHCTKIGHQARQGVSSDGQMIVHTGLLPLKEGIVSMEHSSNKYFSLFDCCENSTIVLPHSDDVWNQNYMNQSYGFTKKKISPTWNDNYVFNYAMDCVEEGVERISVVTLGSHIPFTTYWNPSESKLNTPEAMPSLMSAYLRSLHHTDILMAELLDKYKNDPKYADYTLVITGDHTIFLESQLREFNEYLSTVEMQIPRAEKYCPLIIFSPKINENKIVDDECYQMDIFPTIKSLVGTKYYKYNGFGVNVMDSVALKNRPFSSERALDLSDKIIKNNYFSNLEE